MELAALLLPLQACRRDVVFYCRLFHVDNGLSEFLMKGEFRVCASPALTRQRKSKGAWPLGSDKAEAAAAPQFAAAARTWAFVSAAFTPAMTRTPAPSKESSVSATVAAAPPAAATAAAAAAADAGSRIEALSRENILLVFTACKRFLPKKTVSICLLLLLLLFVVVPQGLRARKTNDEAQGLVPLGHNCSGLPQILQRDGVRRNNRNAVNNCEISQTQECMPKALRLI